MTSSETASECSIQEITEETEEQFYYWRQRVFYSMFFGYAFYYLTRKSFTFVMPAMIYELGIDKAQLGFLASLLSISYAVSKFGSGILADKTNPRYLMGWGLVVTGVINIAFGLSSSLVAFGIFWALNGVFQGFGAPPCARLLIHWFSQKERGTWWSIWNTSHNIGGALIPVIAGFCADRWGWRSGMLLPGVLCTVGGLLLINRLRDTPESLGLPTVERMKGEEECHSDEGSSAEKPSLKELLLKHVLGNKIILLLGVAYFFVYVIRTGVNDWSALYLIETKGYDGFGAGGVVLWFEVGGFCGSLVAGWASDKIFGGRRGPVNVIFAIGSLAALAGFWFLPVSHYMLDAAMLFGMGFMIFGPQMLVGMAAAELADKKAAATVTGFVGWFAYMGAASAGYPLGRIAEDYGWNGLFFALCVCCVIAALLLLPLWSLVPNQVERRRRLKPLSKKAVAAA